MGGDWGDGEISPWMRLQDNSIAPISVKEILFETSLFESVKTIKKIKGVKWNRSETRSVKADQNETDQWKQINDMWVDQWYVSRSMICDIRHIHHINDALG